MGNVFYSYKPEDYFCKTNQTRLWLKNREKNYLYQAKTRTTILRGEAIDKK